MSAEPCQETHAPEGFSDALSVIEDAERMLLRLANIGGHIKAMSADGDNLREATAPIEEAAHVPADLRERVKACEDVLLRWFTCIGCRRIARLWRPAERCTPCLLTWTTGDLSEIEEAALARSAILLASQEAYDQDAFLLAFDWLKAWALRSRDELEGVVAGRTRVAGFREPGTPILVPVGEVDD